MEVEDIQAALAGMEADPTLITDSVYSANVAWAGNRMPFAVAHLAYLKARPNLSPRQYLANLRLRIKRR